MFNDSPENLGVVLLLVYLLGGVRLLFKNSLLLAPNTKYESYV